jgi:hypothetical protein
VIVFGLLVAPWPGWPEAYARCLRKSATAVFGSLGSKGIVRFTLNPSDDKMFDTIIYVANREQLDASYSGPAETRVFDSRLLAYSPTVLVIALILATGISWRRRCCALVGGLVWIHVFIAFLLGLMIISTVCANPSLGLFEVSPFWQKIVSLLFKFFVTRGDACLVTAVPIWIVVTFRREDWIKILGKEEAGVNKCSHPLRN